MKVALVHDYLNEYGGAERVLQTLTEMYPDAPIYTAFAVPGASATQAFAGKTIHQSWFNQVPFYQKLYSPLRFLIPLIWGHFDFSGYDVVITSASWYVTKGVGKRWSVPEICYCHTPPRWMYGFETSMQWKRWKLVQIYGEIMAHFLRMYDFTQAQKVTEFVANSRNVAARIQKFYRRESTVIYPPCDLSVSVPSVTKKDYYLMVTRVVGGKGIEMAVEAARKGKFKLVVAGERAGWASNIAAPHVTFCGRVSEEEKVRLMSEARGFLALARDEDFGITVVEAQLCGTPVVAFRGGGYTETVQDGKTGLLFDDYSADGLLAALTQFEKMKFSPSVLKKWGQTFSSKSFKEKMEKLVRQCLN